MRYGPTWATREKKNYPETAESGQFWRSTLIDSDSRLRVARGIAKDETQASLEVFQTLQRRGHPEGPPPIISDGWGGIDDAMVEVYGLVPEYGGRGRPPTRKQPQPDWQYLQMVKVRDEHGKFQGTKLRVIFGSRAEVLALLGKSTAYIERSQLTSRLFNGRQVRKTLAFSKRLDLYRASAVWEDAYYNLVRPHKSLRQAMHSGRQKWQQTTPAMAAGLTNHIWTVKELLTIVPVPRVSNTCQGDYLFFCWDESIVASCAMSNKRLLNLCPPAIPPFPGAREKGKPQIPPINADFSALIDELFSGR
jgi:hypothetical protein